MFKRMLIVGTAFYAGLFYAQNGDSWLPYEILFASSFCVEMYVDDRIRQIVASMIKSGMVNTKDVEKK